MSVINHPHQPGLTTEALQADVNAAKETFGQCEYAFTYVTVQALLDKIKELENKESIIGKKYYPIDNSYSVNLTSSGSHPYNNEKRYLAGIGGHNPTSQKECIVQSEPFDCNITFLGKKYVEKMVVVSYEGESYTVLFFEHCFEPKIESSLEYLMPEGPDYWEDF